MKLLGSLTSPYVRKVRVVMAEKKLDFQLVLEDVWGSEAILASNPLGKVPCLVLDSGQAIMDSEVICSFLDRELGDGRLSRALEADWGVRTFYSVCSGLLDSLVLLRLEKVREKEGLRSEFWWQRYQAAIVRTLDYLEAHAGALPSALSLAGINLACALGYIELRHAEVDWRQGRSTIVQHVDHLEKRESLVATRLRD